MTFINHFPLKYIEDERGAVMHFLKNTDEYFKNFGECYFSLINPGFVKGWYRHKISYSLLTSPTANLQIVIYDNRGDSKFFGQVESIKIQKDNYGLVSIPPGVWYSFKSVNKESSIIMNFLDNIYDSGEVDRLAYDTKEIPFNWNDNV